MAGHHGSSPLRRGSLQDALLSLVRGAIRTDAGKPTVSDLRTHRSDPHKTAKAAKAAALCRQHSEADLRRLVREMAVGASHVIIRVARDSDEMQGKRNLLTTHGQGAMP